jgi:hypothetical protein
MKRETDEIDMQRQRHRVATIAALDTNQPLPKLTNMTT